LAIAYRPGAEQIPTRATHGRIRTSRSRRSRRAGRTRSWSTARTASSPARGGCWRRASSGSTRCRASSSGGAATGVNPRHNNTFTLNAGWDEAPLWVELADLRVTWRWICRWSGSARPSRRQCWQSGWIDRPDDAPAAPEHPIFRSRAIWPEVTERRKVATHCIPLNTRLRPFRMCPLMRTSRTYQRGGVAT
jgi:hypothetical protein